jgi:hypothetical protein
VKEHKAKWCSQRGLNIRSLRKAVDIYNQLADHLRALRFSVMEDLDSATLVGDQNDGQDLRRALTSGLFMHAAMRQSDGPPFPPPQTSPHYLRIILILES